MQLGYNTNGLTGVNAVEAIDLLHAIGYRGIALTLDRGLLNPFADDREACTNQAAEQLRRRGMRSVIETGARFLLDPAVKHEPTLVAPDPADRARRVDFLCRAIDVAAAIQSDCVSLWSGIVRDGAGDREAINRLVAGLADVLDHAQQRNVVLAFEPEPGMFIDTLDRYGNLLDELERQRIETSRLRLTIDVGHLHCQGELPIAGKIRQWANRLANVHIEDMRSGVHEHLMFGEGEIEFPPVIAVLAEIEYAGLLGIELSRHAHVGPQAAQQAYNYLRPLCDAVRAGGGHPAEGSAGCRVGSC